MGEYGRNLDRVGDLEESHYHLTATIFFLAAPHPVSAPKAADVMWGPEKSFRACRIEARRGQQGQVQAAAWIDVIGIFGAYCAL